MATALLFATAGLLLATRDEIRPRMFSVLGLENMFVSLFFNDTHDTNVLMQHHEPSRLPKR